MALILLEQRMLKRIRPSAPLAPSPQGGSKDERAMPNNDEGQ
jgi:hypothetical protein